MAYDENDPADRDLLAKKIADAAKGLHTQIAERDAKLATLTGERDALAERATKAAADLAAAMESGTATASEITKLRERVAAADKAEADRAAAALTERVGKLPEAVRAKAPTDPAALATWLDIAEAMPSGLAARTGAGGGGSEVTDEMRTFAERHLGAIAKTSSDDTIRGVWTTLAKLRPSDPAAQA